MSGTRRTPLNRRSTAMITPTALEAFRRLVALDGEFGDEWWAAQWTIHRECGCKPWEMAVEYPGMGEWPLDEAAYARWRAFEEAASAPTGENSPVAKRTGRRKREPV